MIRFKLSYILIFVAALLCTTSCDETTDEIGAGLAGNMDRFIANADTFLIQSQTKMLGAVQCRSSKANLGCIRDYDTGSLIRGSYSTQFYILDGDLFPELDSIRSTNPKFEDLADKSHIAINQVISDSTYIYVVPTNIIGDSLQPMHLNVYELTKPIPDGKTYLSDFDPSKEGYVDINSKPLKSMTFTMADQTVDSVTANSSDYTSIFRIPLNETYERDGVSYNNLGSYIMQRYYQSKRDNDGAFNNSNTFAHKVFPGIYVTIDNGEGAMATISGTGINIGFHYWANDTTTNSPGHTTLFGTDEVLQTTCVETNKDALQSLISDNYTYLKSPAGLYTELTIPVEKVMENHEKDSLSKAKVTLQCMNSDGYEGKSYKAPSYVLMIPADSVQTFFNEKKLTDGRTAFLASYSSSANSYTFDNFAGMIAYMNNLKKSGKASENWNKVAIIPVAVSTTSSQASSSYSYYGYSSGNTSTKITAIIPEMSLSSVKLVGGPNAMEVTKMSVVYTKMDD